MLSLISSTKMAAAAVAALVGTGGAAYAGVLPEPAQSAVASAAAKAGLALPQPDLQRGDDVEENEPDAAQQDGAGDAEGAGVDGDTHGAAVREVAQDPSLTGKAKGKAVSEVASSHGRATADAASAQGRATAEAASQGAAGGDRPDPAGKPAGTPAPSSPGQSDAAEDDAAADNAGKPAGTPGGGPPS